MKIFKYLLLLLLLFSFAFGVFVFTKDGRYTFEERLSINLDKSLVMPYIENHDLWKQWFDFEQPIEKINVSEKTFSWDNDKNHLIKNQSNDSIKYTATIDDITTVTFIKILENNKSTEIIWRGEGQMSFKEKLFYYLPFKTNSSIQTNLKTSLSKLKDVLTQRYLKHEIIFGEVQSIPSQELFIVPFESSAKNLLTDSNSISKKADSILFSKSLTKIGQPFIFYDYQNQLDTLSTYTIATQIKMDSIFYASKTKLFSTKSFQAVKVTLKGNYAFKKDVFEKLDKHLEKIKFERSNDGFIIEKHIKGEKDNLVENDWVTEFYFPINQIIQNQPPSNFNPTPIKKEKISEERKPIQPVEKINISVEQPNENLLKESQE